MEAAETLESFFYEKVGAALREQRIQTDPHTEHYLVRLLAGFAHREIDDSPLGVKLLEALESDPAERRRQLRDVGDTSLYVSGFFGESFERRLVDVDYYIDLGGSAYGELARDANLEAWMRDPLGDVYGTLSDNFARFVEVLAFISRSLMPATAPQDIIRLYERYRRTGSQWVARRLVALGLQPQKSGGRPQ